MRRSSSAFSRFFTARHSFISLRVRSTSLALCFSRTWASSACSCFSYSTAICLLSSCNLRFSWIVLSRFGSLLPFASVFSFRMSCSKSAFSCCSLNRLSLYFCSVRANCLSRLSSKPCVISFCNSCSAAKRALLALRYSSA